MAFAVTSRISDTGATAGQSKTSASFTPAANSLLVVVATAQRENHSTTSAWAISDSASLTWTARPGVSTNITGVFGGDLICWTAPVGGSPAAMTVTVDPWSTSVTGWIGLSIFDITGHNVSTPLAQAGVTNTTTSTGNTVSLTVTLGSAPNTANLVVGAFTGQNDATGAFTAISGFTELQNPTGISDHVGVWYRTGTTTAAVTCTDLGQTVNWGAGVVLEIAAAGGTNYTKTPADPVGVTDARTPVLAAQRAPADAVGVTDARTRVVGGVRAPADSVGLTDAVAKGPGRTLADPTAVTDTAARVVAGVRVTADPVGATDSAARVALTVRAPADPVGVTDSVVAAISHAVADQAGVADAVTAVRTVARTVADLVGVTDAASGDLGASNLQLLNVFAPSTADPHSITITGATAGRDLWLIVNTAAVVTTPGSWELTASRVATMATYIYRLPAGSHSGGTVGVTLDLTAARALAAVAFEARPMDTGTVYASLLAPANGAGSTAWGTGAHTFASHKTVLAIYAFHQAGATPPTFAATSYDRGFTAFADTTWAGTGGASDEAARILVGTAADQAFTADGVTLTIDAAGPTGSAVGFLAFDLDPSLLAFKADPVGVTDVRTVLATAARTVADLVGVTDAAARAQGLARTVANPVGVTDSVSADLTTGTNYTKTPADPVAVTDAATRVVGAVRTVANPVGVTDAAARAVNYVRTVADAVAVTDTGAPQTIDFGYTLADPASLTDTAARVAAMVRARADAVGATDSVAVDLTGGAQRAPADPVGITDATTRIRTVARSQADPVGVADTAARAVGSVRARADSVAVTDSVSAVLVGGGVRNLANPVAISDALVAVLAAARTAADPVGVTDSVFVPGADAWSWLVSNGSTTTAHTALLAGSRATSVDVT